MSDGCVYGRVQRWCGDHAHCTDSPPRAFNGTSLINWKPRTGFDLHMLAIFLKAISLGFRGCRRKSRALSSYALPKHHENGA